MAEDDGWIAVGRADAIEEGGDAMRFDVVMDFGARRIGTSGFVVRFDGALHGWLNQCQHVPVELDWQPGRVFDDTGRHLVCSTHGAVYRPDDGVCIAGPCRGGTLRRIEIREVDGRLDWRPDALVRPPCHDDAPAPLPAPPAPPRRTSS